MSPIVKACSNCGGPRDTCPCAAARKSRARADNRRRAAKNVAHGVSRAHFQRLRLKRLEQAGWLCELRVDRGCTLTATTVHLDPSLAGDHDSATIADVRAACAHCHGVVDGRRSRG